MAKGIKIGELLIEQGVLTVAQVEHILRLQRESNRPFGDLAERIYGVNPKAVEDAWVEQYTRTVGTVDLKEIEFETDVLRVLNRRQAWQFHMLPVHRDQQQDLNIATSRDSLVRAVNFGSRSLDEPLNFLIAEHDQLKDFLMKHYPVPDAMATYSDKLNRRRVG